MSLSDMDEHSQSKNELLKALDHLKNEDYLASLEAVERAEKDLLTLLKEQSQFSTKKAEQ